MVPTQSAETMGSLEPIHPFQLQAFVSCFQSDHSQRKLLIKSLGLTLITLNMESFSHFGHQDALAY